jgi:hypothetical protein
MSTSSGFTVTLPSNSNMDKHPTNKGSLYTVTLSSPLNFSGQTLNDDTRWQVAMLSLHYTHNFFNFSKGCKLYFAMDKPADVTASETPLTKGAVTTEITVDRGEYVGGETLTQWVSERHVMAGALSSGGMELLGMVQLPKHYYSSLQAMYADIVDKFEKVFFLRYKLKLIVTKKNTGFLTLSLSNGGRLSMFTDNSIIGTVLGLQYTELSQDKVDSRMERGIVMYSLATVGTDIPRLKNLHALHVYADVVEPQHVGDIMSPLIGYVDVNGKPGDRINHICNPPIYLPVGRSYIDAIRVRITDEHGQNVMFADLLEHVVLRLHFRKAKSVSFL